MTLIYRVHGEQMMVWDPSLSLHYLPSKRTVTGNYGEGICITVGRRLNFEKIEKLKRDAFMDRKKMQILVSVERELGMKLEGNDWKVKLRKKFMKFWKRVGMALGMKPEQVGDVERFEYVKFRNSEDFMPNFFLMGMALGFLDSMSTNETLNVAMGKFRQGYETGKQKYIQEYY